MCRIECTVADIDDKHLKLSENLVSSEEKLKLNGDKHLCYNLGNMNINLLVFTFLFIRTKAAAEHAPTAALSDQEFDHTFKLHICMMMTLRTHLTFNKSWDFRYKSPERLESGGGDGVGVLVSPQLQWVGHVWTLTFNNLSPSVRKHWLVLSPAVCPSGLGIRQRDPPRSDWVKLWFWFSSL